MKSSLNRIIGGLLLGLLISASVAFVTDAERRRGTELKAKGDLLSHDGTAGSSRVLLGTDGNFLVANSTATSGLEWTNTLAALNLHGTLVTGGTTNAQTINKSSGRINLGIPSTSTFYITNSLVTTNSLIFANLATADATARLGSVVAGTGLITITLGTTNTTETKLNWLIVNTN